MAQMVLVLREQLVRAEEDIVGDANTYFVHYHKYVTNWFGQPKMPIDKTWRPKRRRTSMSSESG